MSKYFPWNFSYGIIKCMEPKEITVLGICSKLYLATPLKGSLKRLSHERVIKCITWKTLGSPSSVCLTGKKYILKNSQTKKFNFQDKISAISWDYPFQSPIKLHKKPWSRRRRGWTCSWARRSPAWSWWGRTRRCSGWCPSWLCRSGRQACPKSVPVLGKMR